MQSTIHEIPFQARSGWPVLIGQLVYLFGFGALLIAMGAGGDERLAGILAIPFGTSVVPWVILLPGYFVVGPNESRVLVLFGKYRGTVREQGFFWTNPFTSKKKLSLKAHNLASKTIKVNDLLGNPIEIGGVVVWQVRDTAQACFDVEDYANYVDVQIETAIREIAKRHPYDDGQTDETAISLRGATDAVTNALCEELQARLSRAGIHVIEARISHLAYAPEIAHAMLQRQQASAIIAARTKIVEGAVTMVEMALADLSKRGVIELDAERRATLVGNLLVVLCGQTAAQPVVNAGSLYT